MVLSIIGKIACQILSILLREKSTIGDSDGMVPSCQDLFCTVPKFDFNLTIKKLLIDQRPYKSNSNYKSNIIGGS